MIQKQVSRLIPGSRQEPKVVHRLREAVAEEDVPLEGVALDADAAVDADAAAEDVNNLISILFTINKIVNKY